MDEYNDSITDKKSKRTTFAFIGDLYSFFQRKNKTTLSVIAVLLFISFFEISFKTEKTDEEITRVLRFHVTAGIKELASGLEEMKNAIDGKRQFDSAQIALLKIKFLKCRIAFKKIEAFTSHYFPASEKNMNGPVVSEIEDEREANPKVEQPHGFQVMEDYLWSEAPQQHVNELSSEVERMHRNILNLGVAFNNLTTTEFQFIEAIQYHVVRIFFLGISNFDTPESNNALAETRASFITLAAVFKHAYQEEPDTSEVSITREFERVVTFFNNTSSLKKMNYLVCLRDYYIPLSKSLAVKKSKVQKDKYVAPSAIDFEKPSLFDVDAFNAYFYNPNGTHSGFQGEVAELGRVLFFDPLFSENNKRACASCHKPGNAFTDNAKTSPGFHGDQTLLRNTPTILNAALQREYFYDMRAFNLEMQIGMVLTNEKEMAGNYDTLVAKLSASPGYVDYFKRVFRGTADTTISMKSIVNAIAEYERTLVSFNSRFDRNVRGEENTMTAEEQNGFNIFMNKGRCATCHYLPLFNNLVPPIYTRSEWEIIGTTATSDLSHPVLDPDPGRGGLYGTEIFMNAFKTPTLRNIALTGPYMHNGAFQKLEDVIDFYDRGGGAGLGLSIPNQTLPSDKLFLTKAEKENLVLFLHTLTDTTNLTTVPPGLPSFPMNHIYNLRKTGGEY